MRRRRNPENIFQAASTSFELIQITSKVNELKKLNTLIQSIIPEELKGHCTVANIHIKTGTLILSTSSPIWKHKARFMLESILIKLRNHKEYVFIKDITIIVAQDLGPNFAHKSKVDNRLPKPTEQTINQIAETSKSIKSERLAKALDSLAKKWMSMQTR
ncbi:MAG: DUF721 domain-containing protein [Francisellaceae bacterium]|jgi:hypothetical protein|nr:DUF721 domain-containing protein [Francisellaceae bacterium]MBT6206601.1 DUF721 domain-containing protein [Francisellaceae bacterium]MBT6539250.1 DUF721 domain-containing protein [Francisellaceae bacterium]